MKRSRVSDAQAAFNWEAPPPAPVAAPIVVEQGRKMTAEDHRWFAGAYRGKQEEMIGRAAEWPEHGAELAKVAAQWKQMATVHEFTANRMEGTE